VSEEPRAAALMHTYEILAHWEPGGEPKAGMGRRAPINMAPDKDGYARFDKDDGSGWEGRHVHSYEVPGAVGEAIARLTELTKTEEGREILTEAYKIFKEQRETG
jgi:hypothetical protein